MESTRNWLANAIGRDVETLAEGLACWLQAAGAATGPALGRAVLEELRAWLRRTDGAAFDCSTLGSRRARQFARSFVNEQLKNGGHLGISVDDETRAREIDTLLDLFFAVGPAIAIQHSPVAGTPRPPKPSSSRGETPRSGAFGPAGENK